MFSDHKMFNLKVLVVLLVSAFVAEGCELSLDKNRPGVFLQQFSSKKLVLDVSGGSVSFAEGSTIQGYCSSGFRYPTPKAKKSRILYYRTLFSEIY